MAINTKPTIDGGTVTNSKPKAPTPTAPSPALSYATMIGSGRGTSNVQSSSPATSKAPTSPTAGTFIRWDYVGQSQTTGTLRRAVTSDGKGGEKINYTPEKNPDYVSGSRGGVTQTGMVTSNITSSTPMETSTGPSTNIDVLKSLLIGAGYNSKTVDSSVSFLMSLIKDGLDYDNAVQVFANSKDYTLKNGTKITSPFYTEYGYINEGLTTPKSPSELYNFAEGTRALVKKYGMSSKFAEPDALKKFAQNNVDVTSLDERFNSYRLAALNADPFKVDALIKLGFISAPTGLMDFYANAEIGTKQLESNRQTGAFAAEALRRANRGITFDKVGFEKEAAGLAAKGYNEAQIGTIASTGFENIAQQLGDTVSLSNIFEGKNAADAATIQKELQAQEFQGTESDRQQRLKELGTRIMQGKTGRQTGNYKSAGMI